MWPPGSCDTLNFWALNANCFNMANDTYAPRDSPDMNGTLVLMLLFY